MRYWLPIGKDIHTLGEFISVKEFANTLAALSGKEVGYNEISNEAFLAENGVKKNPMKIFYDQCVLHLSTLPF